MAPWRSLSVASKRFLQAFAFGCASLLCHEEANGQACLERLPDVPSPPDDQRFLDDFGAALRRFRGMTLEDLRAELGPGAYRPPGVRFIRGDANSDGKVNLSDAICALSFLFLGEGPCAAPRCLSALDADDTGTILLSDPIRILAALFLGGPPPAAPFPQPGADPTPDALTCDLPPSAVDYEPVVAQHFEGIDAAYRLSEPQEEAYRESGFVILDDEKLDSFPAALSSVYTNHLPVYISVDALLDALHHSFDEVLKRLETQLLMGQLDAMLAKLDSGLSRLEGYAGGRDISEDLNHLSFWICTARSLLRGEKSPCARPVDAVVEELLGNVASEECRPISLFGVPPEPMECEDFSQFKPRSHYTDSVELERYFRAMMWVQRIGMRFAECPSHAAVAFLLAHDLLNSGAVEEWKRINDVVEATISLGESCG